MSDASDWRAHQTGVSKEKVDTKRLGNIWREKHRLQRRAEDSTEYCPLLSPIPYFTDETQVAHPPGLVKLTTADEAANATNETIEAGVQRGISKISHSIDFPELQYSWSA